MSRLPELKIDDMNEAQRAVAQEIISGPHGNVRGPYPAWLRSPELARRARALSEFIRFQSSLPALLRELAIIIAGRHWSAELEFHAHSKLALQAGLDEAVIRAIAERRRPDFSDDKEETVYELCMEMFGNHRISDAVYARALSALGEPGVVELIATLGYYSMVSMTLNAFQVALPPGEPSPFPD